MHKDRVAVSGHELPREILKLFPREREIAETVYALGLATAKEVQAQLENPLSNAATRSMLNRLVRKGILGRSRKADSLEYVYTPALNPMISRERALRQLAEDFFGGSLQEAAAAVIGLARRTNPPQHGIV